MTDLSPVNADQTVVAASATAVALLPANGKRRGVSIHNNGSEILYVLCDNATSPPTVSATVFTAALAVGAAWQMPLNYQGAVTGLWAGTPTGSAQVTQYLV